MRTIDKQIKQNKLQKETIANWGPRSMRALAQEDKVVAAKASKKENARFKGSSIAVFKTTRGEVLVPYEKYMKRQTEYQIKYSQIPTIR